MVFIQLGWSLQTIVRAPAGSLQLPPLPTPSNLHFGPGALATLQLLAALAEEARFEYFYLWPQATLYPDWLVPDRGELAIPRGPGLGADPNPEVLARYRAE